LGSGAAAFALLGCAHAFLTFVDFSSQRAFVPTNAAVVAAMRETTLALSPTANLWKFWIGYNFTHSLGLIVFGSAFALIAWREPRLFLRYWFLRLAATGVAGAYAAAAYLFFFPPAFFAAGAGFLLILIAVIAWRGQTGETDPAGSPVRSAARASRNSSP
jgi:hypothetical protein